jgi:hypothetical protein
MRELLMHYSEHIFRDIISCDAVASDALLDEAKILGDAAFLEAYPAQHDRSRRISPDWWEFVIKGRCIKCRVPPFSHLADIAVGNRLYNALDAGLAFAEHWQACLGDTTLQPW